MKPKLKYLILISLAAVTTTVYLAGVGYILSTRPELTLITLCSITLGVIYAAFIYHKPFDWIFGAGWTWVSVLIGEILTEGTETAFIVNVPDVVLGNFAWLLPWYSEALAGGPMIVGQILFLASQIIENNHIIQERHNGRGK